MQHSNSAIHPVGVRLSKMKPAEERADRESSRLLENMFQRVDSSRVGASENDGQPLRSGNKKRHVVDNGVGNSERFIQKERPTDIFERIRPRNFSGYPNARDDFGRSCHTTHDPGFPEILSLHEVGRNPPGRAFRGTYELSLGSGGVEPQRGSGGLRKSVWQAGDMVVVGMTENYRVSLPKVDSEFFGVVRKCHALAGVKKHSVRAGV